MSIFSTVNGIIKPRWAFKKCGVGVHISFLTYIRSIDKVSCGNFVYIGPFGKISAVGGLTIGDNVSVSFDVTILTTNHNFDSEKMTSIPYDHIYIREPVVIGDHVFIGARSIILPGVRIGKGAFIGAGSVVSKNVDPYAIVGGNPARVLRSRKHLDKFKYLERERRFLIKEDEENSGVDPKRIYVSKE